MFPSHLQRVSIKAMQRPLEILEREDLSGREDNDLMVTFKEGDRIVGLHDSQELEKRFLTLPSGECGA
jgi:hypothetical protein